MVLSCLGLRVCLFVCLLPQSSWNVPLVLRPLDVAESACVAQGSNVLLVVHGQQWL